MNWSPSEEKSETWTPKGGWNPIWSEQEKIKAIHLFFFLLRRKNYPSPQAESLVHMFMWKQKYPALCYSTGQEAELQKALCPLVRRE